MNSFLVSIKHVSSKKCYISIAWFVLYMVLIKLDINSLEVQIILIYLWQCNLTPSWPHEVQIILIYLWQCNLTPSWPHIWTLCGHEGVRLHCHKYINIIWTSCGHEGVRLHCHKYINIIWTSCGHEGVGLHCHKYINIIWTSCGHEKSKLY
jgi:uncharacterized protein YbdZ (MbtH family)